MISNKHYRRFSQISSIFVAVYAVLGFPLGIYFETDIFDGIEAYLGIFLLIAGILAPCIALSFPFFGPVALSTLLIKLIVYIRNKPTEKKRYIKDMLLHLVCSLMGMAGIFLLYYDKFGNPFR